nr:hypothetical protein [Clostridia bacterium]
MADWLWLPPGVYPGRQSTKYSCMLPDGETNYTVCEFRRVCDFGGRAISSVEIEASGDTAFILFEKNRQILRGPVWVGGDFLFNDERPPEFYSTRCSFAPEEPAAPFELRALVRMGSVRICEYSRGEGGFFLRGTVFFEDGGSEAIETDGSWRGRLLGAYTAPYSYDGNVAPGEFEAPSLSTGPVETIAAPIPPCEVSPLPVEGLGFTEHGAGKSSRETELDKVYACYVSVRVSGAPARVKLTGYELPGGSDFAYDLDFTGPGEYHGMELHAVGGVRIELEKPTPGDTSVSAELLASSYPTPYRAMTVTSDAELDLVLDVCAHSLKYCRQSIHLDSPKHCEPLACTGDYYIETLMTAFTYGDMRLAAFDVRRTALRLNRHDGRIFHTSYSLIWALMLWDVYMLTGERRLLSDCRGALDRLLARFDGYLGENGLIETPPDYMFVDWLDPDGINLHHPPKALGQTCLCMFYFGALRTAEKIYRELGDEASARGCFEKSAALREACLSNLWDAERGLFFEGLNTPTPEELLNNYMPANVGKRYYRRHANILAAYFGFFGSRPAGTASHTGDSADA